MRRGLVISMLVGGLALIGAGCVSFSSNGAGTGADGGVFKTSNKGDSWAQKTAVPTVSGAAANINNVNVATITQDPQDAAALYIGTASRGMYYTYDSGETWRQPEQLSRGRIASIAVSPKDKCTIYATTGNTVIKSEDCSRSWKTTYPDPRPETQMVAVVVDHFNPNVVWAVNDAGDVLKSTDAGGAWTNVISLKKAVVRMVMNKADSRRVYVATKSSGIWRTADGGASWDELADTYKDYSGAKEFTDIALGSSDPNVVVFTSKYGLLRSSDGGNSWDEVPLLTPPGTTPIYSVALDPKDANNIYYGTSTTFYRSPNGGVNWVPKKLPTSRTATVLLVDSLNSSTLYMGVTKF